MMNILILVLIISANCVKTNCDEEGSTTEIANGVTEKSESLAIDAETLENKTENKENDTNKSSGNAEETRVSRSSSPDHSTENEAQLENSSEVPNTEKKSASDEISEAKEKQADNIEENQSTRRAYSKNATEEDTKSSEKVEKQLEESTKTSASVTEDRKPQDLKEASAESKLSDNEKASSSLNDTDRNSETEKAKDISDELFLKEIRATRRMFSAPDDIVVDSKMRADTISTTIKPELRTARNQNLNLYNNYKEFGTNSHTKLSDPSRVEPSPANEKTSMPVITKLAPEEILNQRYLTKFNPRPVIGMTFPNVNSDFHGPRDLPIYLDFKQGGNQNLNQFTEPQMSQFRSTQENTYFPPNIQQQYHQLHQQRSLPAGKFENILMGTRNQAPRLYQNPDSAHFKTYMDNQHIANMNQVSRNHIQQFNQNHEKINDNPKHFRDLNLETRSANIEGSFKTPLNDNDFGNEYPLLHQQVEMNQFSGEQLANPYSYMQNPSPQRMNVALIPPNISLLFQKLAKASLFPTNLKAHIRINRNSNKPNRPYFAFPDYAAGFPFNFG